MTTEINDYAISGSTIIDSTGNFNVLTINNTGILLSGQLYLNDIVDISGNITGLNYLGESPSGTFLFTTGLNQFTTGVITDFARSILDDANVSEVRTTLGLESLSTVSGVLVLGSEVAQDIILSNVSGSGTIFNNERKDIDFYVKGTGLTDSFYYDASTGRLGVNTLQPDTALHIVGKCALDGLKVESSTNCTTGVHFLLQHNPGISPIEGSYPVTISLAGRDDNANVIYYAQLRSKAVYTDGDSENGTQGELLGYIDHDSSGNLVMRLANSGTTIGPHNTIPSGSYGFNVIGSGNNIDANSFVVLGNDNVGIDTTNGIIVGLNNASYNINNTIVGKNIQSYGSGDIIVGLDVFHTGNNNYIYANDITYSGHDNSLIGSSLEGSGNYVILFGQNLYNQGDLNIIIGSGINAISNYSVLMGYDIITNGNSGIILGTNNAVTGDGNILIGNNLDVISTGLFICGESIDVNNVSDSLILEKDIIVSNASGIVIVGRGNDITSTNNILGIYGYKNTTRNTIKNSNILGDSNKLSAASGSLVLGTMNIVSGTINNDIVVGKQNYLTNSSNNNIFIGNLNNQSGLRLNNDGSTTGTIAFNDSRFINMVSVGNQNVFQSSGNLQVSIGNKNDVNGLYGTVVGNINTIRNGNYHILIGKSNYLVGPTNIVIANNARVLGNNNVVLSPSDDARIFGQDVISVGANNGLQSNGSVIGYDNNLYGDNNNILGSNNSAGFNKYLYTATITSSQFASSLISFNSNITTDIQQGDNILVYLYNPTPTDNNNTYVFERTVQTIQWNGSSTAIVLNSNINLQTNNPQSNPNNFNEAFSATVPTLASGYIIKKSLGSNNYIYGDNNTVLGTGNNVIGYRNSISAYTTGSFIVGNNITHNYGNDYMVIGPTDETKILIGDNVIINTGNSISNVYAVGTNNVAYFNLNNSNRRVGIINTNPRSALDVSGTITTSALRIGLSANDGEILLTDNNGNISFADRTTNSGSVGGLNYKISNTLSSGVDYFRWNSNNNQLVFYSWDDPITPDPDPFEWVPSVKFIPNTGLIVNANRSNNDDFFNFIVYGNDLDGNQTELLVADTLNNKILLHETFMVSGVFSDGVKISGSLELPNLRPSGTLLSISNEPVNSGSLVYSQISPYTVLSTTVDNRATGYMNLRWFEDKKKLCIGNISTHTDNSDAFVENEYNTIISNAIDLTDAANGNNYTVFNRDGLGSWAGSGFVVLYSGLNNRGLRLDYTNSKMGVNTTAGELANKSNALVVNGSIYGTALRLGESATSGYVLTAVDDIGNVGFRQLQLNLAESSIQYPFVFETVNNVEKLKLSSYDENGTPLVSSSNYNDLGRVLAWNGDSDNWYSPPHFRLYKGTATAQKHNILFGEYASNYYLTTQNLHAFSAGSFHSSESTYEGSTQYLQFYLRGSGNGSATCELSTDFSYDDTDNTPNSTNANVIKFPSSVQLYHSWMYEAMISVVGRNTNTNVYSAGAVKLVGAVRRLGNGGPLAHIGNYKQDIFNDSALDGIGAEMVFSPGTAGAGTMTIRCTGVANHTTAWSATVKINQLSMPSVL